MTVFGAPPAYAAKTSSSMAVQNPNPLGLRSAMPMTGIDPIVGTATRRAAGGEGTGGPFPTGDLSPADAVAASEVNKLRQNPKGRTQLRTTTDAVVKIQRNGNRVTGTIADSLGSIDFNGDYVDVPGKASVRIANMRVTPSIGTLVNPPTTLTISRNVNQRLVFEFDKDVSVRVFPFTRTQYRGRQAYQPNPPIGGGR